MSESMPILNVEEVFRMAEEVERNGARFYRAAAERFTEDQTVHELLVQLAAMEDDHERTFAELREKAVGAKTGWKDDADQTAAAYLYALVDHRFFNPKSDVVGMIDNAEDLIDVLQAAVRLETSSVLFYTGIREGTPADFGREQIDEIVREEMRHVVTLSAELARAQSR